MTARPIRAFLPLAIAASTVVLTAAACGAQTPSTTGSAGSTAGAGASSAPSASPTAAPSSAATAASGAASSAGATATTGASSSSRCTVGDLRIRFANDRGGAGAGNVEGALTFTNTGSTACTLSGFPGVSFVGGGNGTQVGAAATRTDDAVRSRTLAPGKAVTAALRRTQPGNYGDDCQQTKVDGFRVYPPDSTESAFVAFKTTGCKSTAAPLLQVGPVR
jgi:hypothetical protein